MLPFRDENPTRTTPVLTVALIAANAAAFLYELSLGPVGGERLIMAMGLIPREITTLSSLPGSTGVSPPWTLLTSTFLHGGWGHLLGNMLYLWIFGNNVEDQLGHGRFLLFYLVMGVLAGLTQVLANPASTVPTIGASGAIAGVLGAYLFLFPRARVLTLLVYGFFVRVVRLPALVVLGLWFLFQFLAAIPSSGAEGGVAWFAHIGGFVAGFLLIRVFLL